MDSYRKIIDEQNKSLDKDLSEYKSDEYMQSQTKPSCGSRLIQSHQRRHNKPIRMNLNQALN